MKRCHEKCLIVSDNDVCLLWLHRRAISVQFTNPFRTSTRIVSRGKDGSLLLQVQTRTLH